MTSGAGPTPSNENPDYLRPRCGLALREGVMSDIRSTLEALCEAFNAHDLDAIMAHFADDCLLEMPRGPHPWGTRSEGKTAVREALAGRFQGLPDAHYGD